jgi:hypothetical protein
VRCNFYCTKTKIGVQSIEFDFSKHISRADQKMDFALILTILQWEVILFTGGLAATIAIKALTGQVNTRFLLYGMQRDGSRYFSPERVQMLLATIAIAMQYLMLSQHTQSGQMPALPNGSLEILGLSHVVYLGGKGLTTFRTMTK